MAQIDTEEKIKHSTRVISEHDSFSHIQVWILRKKFIYSCFPDIFKRRFAGKGSDFSICDTISIKSGHFNICGPYPYELRFPAGDKSNSRDINRHKGERIINFHCDVVWSSTYNVVWWAFVIIHIHEMPISIVLPAFGFDPVCFFVVDTISLFRTRCPFVLLPLVLCIILIDLSVILL